MCVYIYIYVCIHTYIYIHLIINIHYNIHIGFRVSLGTFWVLETNSCRLGILGWVAVPM